MPNVLFIAADDLCHLDRMLAVLVSGYELPSLRRLMSSGTDFDRAYCCVPVCEPARTAVMSGFSPADTRSFDLTEGWKDILRPEHLWAYQFRQAGYWMGTTGKIYHGYDAQPQWVYDVLYDSERFVIRNWNPATAGAEDRGGMYGLVFEDETLWYDYERATEAINMINARPVGQPWFIECGFHHPHNAWYSPRRIHDMVPLENVIIPASWQGGFDTLPFVRQFIGAGELSSSDPALWTAEETLYVRQTIRNYAAGALWMDVQLGRVLDALEASPHANDTIVTFYSDHGYHLSDHSRWHKFTLYEQSACAPMVIRAPGQVPRKVAAPVSHVDLGATLLDLCGLPIREGHRGVSLKPWIDGETPAPRVIPTFWYGSTSVASDDKRVTVYQDGSSEMFNIVSDVWSKTNISTADPAFEALREAAIVTARDWGFMVVEEAVDTSRPGPLQSFLGTMPTDTHISTSFVALGDFDSTKGRSPGYQRMWGAAETNGGIVRMPPHVEDFSTMGRSAAKMHLIGNALNNVVRIEEAYWQEFRADLGEGDDEIVRAGSTRVIAYGGPGNDTLRAGAWGGNRLYGGPGDDSLIGGANNDYLEDGPGNDYLDGGAGNDTLVATSGTARMVGGAGDDLLIVTGGQNRLHGGAGADTFRIMRTGLIQTITDLNADDRLDLSDWAGIQPVRLVQAGPDCHVTAGVELIICEGRTIANVQPRISGVDIAA